jgi:hypothetical protein
MEKHEALIIPPENPRISETALVARDAANAAAVTGTLPAVIVKLLLQVLAPVLERRRADRPPRHRCVQ